MRPAHNGIAASAAQMPVPNFYAAPIYRREAATGFALSVSYLPVGLGRAKARPFFWSFAVNHRFAGSLDRQIPSLSKVWAEGTGVFGRTDPLPLKITPWPHALRFSTHGLDAWVAILRSSHPPRDP